MALTQNKNLLAFLRTLQQYGLFNDHQNPGLVVYADDQFINQNLMKMKFQELGIEDKLILFANGKEVVDYFESLLHDSELTTT